MSYHRRTKDPSSPRYSHTISRTILILTLALAVLSPSAKAFCFLGIGNTCENNNPINWVLEKGTSLLNTVKNVFSKVSETNDKVESTIKESTDESSYDKAVEEIEQDNIIGDNDKVGSYINVGYTGGTTKAKLMVKGKSQVLTENDAMWYDLDIVGLDVDCTGCIKEDIEAGHTLNIYFLIKNYGNVVNTEEFSIVGTIETPDGKIPLRYENMAAYISSGSTIEFSVPIPRFGVNADSTLKDWAKGSDYIDLEINLQIINDKSVVYPGRVKATIPKQRTYFNEEVWNECKNPACPFGMGASDCADFREMLIRECRKSATQSVTYYVTEIRYSCPDGTDIELSQLNSCKVEQLGLENSASNSLVHNQRVKQISPSLSGDGAIVVGVV